MNEGGLGSHPVQGNITKSSENEPQPSTSGLAVGVKPPRLPARASSSRLRGGQGGGFSQQKMILYLLKLSM